LQNPVTEFLNSWTTFPKGSFLWRFGMTASVYFIRDTRKQVLCGCGFFCSVYKYDYLLTYLRQNFFENRIVNVLERSLRMW